MLIVDYFDITSDLKHTSVFAKTGPNFYLSQQRFTCRNMFNHRNNFSL